MKAKIISGLLFASVCILTGVLTVGCSLNQDFIKVMESTNIKILDSWREHLLMLPDMDKINKEDQNKLFEGMQAAGISQKKIIADFKKKEGGE